MNASAPEPETKTNARKVLIATNHLAELGGSEIIALEVAEYCISRGCEVTFFANWVRPPMSELIAKLPSTRLVEDPAEIQPFTFDIVYAQHQVLGLFNYDDSEQNASSTAFTIARLSRRSYLESGGWLHDRILSDHTLANSELTAEHLTKYGGIHAPVNFRNAAPEPFIRSSREYSQEPSKVLVVSNHSDPDLLGAIQLLKTKLEVEHIGRSGENVQRVTPEQIAGADIVVSIGKTIPYALAGRTPVYVYDHFGGPGYLNLDNVDIAARFNFTGRCCERKISSEEIAEEIIGNYESGVEFARSSSNTWKEQFHLPRYLEQLFIPAIESNSAKLEKIAKNPFLIQERMLCTHIRTYYRTNRQQVEQIKALKSELEEIKRRPMHHS